MTGDKIRIEALEKQLSELQEHIRFVSKEWARESARADAALAGLRALRTWRNEVEPGLDSDH